MYGSGNKEKNSGFSLMELLVVMAIFSIIAMVLSSMLNTTSRSLITTKERVRQFGNARVAFEYLSRNLKQATLNTYWDYQYSTGDPITSAPDGYTAKSDIQFKVEHTSELLGEADVAEGKFQGHAVFFQAPLGASDRYNSLKNLLNARGYFIEFGDDLSYRPDFLGDRVASRYRYRLKEFRPPGEYNLIYKELNSGDEAAPPEFNEWFRANSDLYDVALPYHKVVRNVADNIIALIVSPRISEKEAGKLGYRLPQEYAPNYTYDSRIEFPTGNENEKSTHKLPPLVKLIMVSISEKSAIDLQDKNGIEPPPELLVEASLFQDALKLTEDLEIYENQLREHNIEYRFFQTVVGMQSAKWSDEN